MGSPQLIQSSGYPNLVISICIPKIANKNKKSTIHVCVPHPMIPYIEPFFVCPMIKSPESYSKTKKREDKWQILFVLSHFSCSLSVSIYLPRIFNYFDFPPGTFFLLYISLSPHPLFDWKSIGDSVGIS